MLKLYTPVKKTMMNTKIKKLACYVALALTYSGLSQLWDIRSQSPMVSQGTVGAQLQSDTYPSSKPTASWPADAEAIGGYGIRGNTDPMFAVKFRELDSRLNDAENED
jgi:hypothetical protein